MLQIRWHGHSCFEITDEVTVVTDPHDGKSIGIPTPSVLADIILVTHNHYDHNSVKTVEKPGSKIITDERKRTIANVEIKGISTFHDEVGGMKRGKNIIYRFTIDDVTFCHMGDLGHELDPETVKQIGDVHILFIPVGGTFSLDAETAWKTIQLIKPCIAVPMHYKISGLSIPVAGVDAFLEKSKVKVVRVGNEIDIEKDDIPQDQEIWVFTL